MERTLDKSSLKGLSKKATDELTKKSEKESLHRTPQKFARLDVLHVTVSTNGNQEETLARSIQTTEELVCKHVGTDLSEWAQSVSEPRHECFFQAIKVRRLGFETSKGVAVLM
jgi:hypothetical protein